MMFVGALRKIPVVTWHNSHVVLKRTYLIRHPFLQSETNIASNGLFSTRKNIFASIAEVSSFSQPETPSKHGRKREGVPNFFRTNQYLNTFRIGYIDI